MEIPKKILVVDDQQDYLQTINNILNESSISVTLFNAPNGKIATELVHKVMPDLIITDWEMPVMNGIELIKWLKADEQAKEIPVIMCTGIMTSASSLQMALEAGAVDYIRKPVDEIELIARTHSVLKLGESRQDILNKNKQLSDLVRLKDKFFSIISHDLRAPLGNLFNLGELLLKSQDDIDADKKRVILEALVKDAKSSYGLLDNLLNWACANSNNLQQNPRDVKVARLVNECVDLLDSSAKSKNIDVETILPDDLTVYVDYNMISTVLRNLIANAIKFTPQDGLVKVHCELLKLGKVKISITDTGVGMDDELIETLFDKDNMYSTLASINETGTGLGLILSKEFIDRNKGEIGVVSKVGEGTTIWIILPGAEG